MFQLISSHQFVSYLFHSELFVQFHSICSIKFHYSLLFQYNFGKSEFRFISIQRSDEFQYNFT